MERTPQKAPLPCYGLEHDRLDPQCQACPHFDGCLKHMGSRADKVPLDRVKFDLTPAEATDKYKDKLRKEAFGMDDPELPYIQRLYSDCYLSVFHKNPTDNISQYREEVKLNAMKAHCSVRMYILANMVAHTVQDKAVNTNTEKQRVAKFHAKLLTGALGIKRAAMYQEMCNDRYGTFTLTSLAVLTDMDDKDDIEAAMLRSEVRAAKWFVRFKIFNGGPVVQALYDSEELHLAPEWLAIEKSYLDTVLKPYMAKEIKGTEAVEKHRYNVFQVHTHYKRNLGSQKLAWISRQRILPQAVLEVVNSFGLKPDDFLYPRITVNDPMQFWLSLSLTLRHYHCWLYLNGEPSYFTPRRNEKLVPRIPRS